MEQPLEQFSYHRLTRSWSGYRWWKPLITGLLGLVFYTALVVILLLAGVFASLFGSEGFLGILDRLMAIDLGDPFFFAFTLISIILMIPALALAALITGPHPVGLLSSVAGRIRWYWLGQCIAAAVVVYGLSFLILFLLPGAPGESTPPADFSLPNAGILLLLTVFLVPLQATAEEYVFRGYLMQAVGSWLRHPAFAILLPVPLFVLGHGYDPLGQAEVGLFAIFAGWITWRTGGLEAAIAAHAVNNMVLFALGAVGVLDVNASEGSALGMVISVLTLGVFAAVIVRLSTRVDRVREQRPADESYPEWPAPAGRPA